MYIDFTLCAIDPLEDGQVMKVDGELGVLDDKESIFSTLKSPINTPTTLTTITIPANGY